MEPKSAAFSPSGTKVYISQYGSGAILVFNIGPALPFMGNKYKEISTLRAFWEYNVGCRQFTMFLDAIIDVLIDQNVLGKELLPLITESIFPSVNDPIIGLSSIILSNISNGYVCALTPHHFSAMQFLLLVPLIFPPTPAAGHFCTQ